MLTLTDSDTKTLRFRRFFIPLAFWRKKAETFHFGERERGGGRRCGKVFFFKLNGTSEMFAGLKWLSFNMFVAYLSNFNLIHFDYVMFHLISWFFTFGVIIDRAHFRFCNDGVFTIDVIIQFEVLGWKRWIIGMGKVLTFKWKKTHIK